MYPVKRSHKTSQIPTSGSIPWAQTSPRHHRARHGRGIAGNQLLPQRRLVESRIETAGFCRPVWRRAPCLFRTPCVCRRKLRGGVSRHRDPGPRSSSGSRVGQPDRHGIPTRCADRDRDLSKHPHQECRDAHVRNTCRAGRLCTRTILRARDCSAADTRDHHAGGNPCRRTNGQQRAGGGYPSRARGAGPIARPRTSR